MRKRDELTAPTSCMSRAKDDEMTFVLLARDIAAPATIRFWTNERVRLAKNTVADAQIVDALHCARDMELQRELTASHPLTGETTAMSRRIVTHIEISGKAIPERAAAIIEAHLNCNARLLVVVPWATGSQVETWHLYFESEKV